MYAHRFVGKRFDCGNKLGYLQATVEYALAHPGLSRAFHAYLMRLTQEMAGNDAAARKAAAKSKLKASAQRKGKAARSKRR